MPDLLDRSLEDMLTAMADQFGVRWPNPWWPTGNPAYDDCAAAVSFFLFGLNSSGNPRYSYVSQLQNYFAGLGQRTWGNAGIQRGDVLAFSWTKDPNSFDHTEIALGPVSPAGLITSRGTNSNPGDDMRDRTRSASYVVSYSRPAYPGTTSAGGGAHTLMPNVEDDSDMKINLLRTGDGSGSIGTVNPDGTVDGLTGDEYAAIARTGLALPLHQEGDGTVWNILTRRTARLRAVQHGDPAALAQSVAALTIPAVLAGLKSAGATGLTQAQVQAAAEAAIRDVFADAATK